MTPEQAKIVEYMGFEICEFPPDNDPCEGCKESGLQLFFQGPTDAGRYLCLECILLENAAIMPKYLRDITAMRAKGAGWVEIADWFAKKTGHCFIPNTLSQRYARIERERK